MKRLLIALLVLAGALVPTGASAASCQFVLGFKVLHDALPQSGSCADDEHDDGNGNRIQDAGLTSTPGGPTITTWLFVWRKADNWTAATDGAHTWVNGPNGIQQRLNGERFAWEAAAPVATPASATGQPATPPAGPTQTGAQCVLGACFKGDSSFMAFLQDLAKTPDGKPLVASTGGATLRFTTVPAEDLGDYDPKTDTVQIAAWLPGSGEFEAASVLAHELTHASQRRYGRLAPGLICYTDEAMAFQAEGRAWSQLWGGILPPDAGEVRTELNLIARANFSNPLILYPAYAKECGQPV